MYWNNKINPFFFFGWVCKYAVQSLRKKTRWSDLMDDVHTDTFNRNDLRVSLNEHHALKLRCKDKDVVFQNGLVVPQSCNSTCPSSGHKRWSAWNPKMGKIHANVKSLAGPLAEDPCARGLIITKWKPTPKTTPKTKPVNRAKVQGTRYKVQGARPNWNEFPWKWAARGQVTVTSASRRPEMSRVLVKAGKLTIGRDYVGLPTKKSRTRLWPLAATNQTSTAKHAETWNT